MSRKNLLVKPVIYRPIAIIIAAVFLLNACDVVNTNTKETTPPAVEPLNISMMVPLHQVKAPPNELISRIEQATQTKLDIDWVPYDIYKEKMINALETNSPKKVIFVNQPDYVYVRNEIRSGMFWEIGPYLDLYPNLKNVNKTILNETSVDERIYGLYTERPASRQGVILRKDWLDRLNLKEPATIDELYNVMKKFTYNDPDGNGKQDTIGLADRNDLVFGAFKTLGSYFGTPNNWGVVEDRLVPEFMTSEYIHTMDFMKKLYDENILNRDFSITSKQVERYMIISGKAGGYIGSLEDTPRLLDELQKLNPAAELTIINRIRGPHGYGVWSIPSFNGLFLFSKKEIKTEAELKKILAYFDRTMESDVSNIMQYGLEGKYYTIEEGKVVKTPAMNQMHNMDVLPLYSLMIANLNNRILKQKEEAQDPLQAKISKLTSDNESILIRDPAQSLFSPTYDMVGGELWPIVVNATYSYILGQIDLNGFQKEIDKWERKGGGQIIKEYTEAYRKRISQK
ncbi:putative aldouronate transport system substrate-binding protein [Paenibacillus sp. 1_12]|uniref:extracellular solute-binding protein n=1 Tax=Paenibacillus sp. 1_12 TaxID=1566278 RepID=UPI0008E67360|nr:extracellular solute-binding protein [Paenibacillus sp. 1_12]SFL14618.1 putative aldouronate transport system substrate-binding protein [Paenibacillus sp. 1_12]